VKTTEFEELKDPKRENDGAVCVSDTCISANGDNFETAGEFCSECRLGFPPEKVLRENLDEINKVRSAHSQKPVV
jgi:hypothetical protein